MFELADKDDQVRVVVLTADPNGAVFCAGVSSVLFSKAVIIYTPFDLNITPRPN